MPWQFNQRQPVFLQIVQRLRWEIVRGVYAPDAQFPTVRQLAAQAAVNPNTVQKALTVLEEEGLLYTRGTVGRFVTSDTAVLEALRERMRREAVHAWVREAHELGIGTEELIRYIQHTEEEST